MPKITFIEHDGTEHVVVADIGTSVMQVALNNLVPGIIGDCGGFCNCATCHGYVDGQWEASLPPANEDEQNMVSCAIDTRPDSRLTCQIQVTDELDGLVVRLPRTQT